MFDDSRVAAPRVEAPAALSEFVTADPRERAERAWGRSYQDVVRAFRGDFRFAPDLVAKPRDEGEIERVLEWAAGANVAVIPYGGGTSVVGGVRPEVPAGFDGIGHARHDRAEQTARVRRRQPRRAHPGRRLGTAARAAARSARHDDAFLSAVVRADHVGRLDRDPRRRSLRHRRDAHRRPHRIDPRDHAQRRLGELPAARVGRRRVARPHAARLGGHAGRRDRGVGARATAAERACAGVGPVRRFRRRRGSRARDRAVGPAAQQLPPDRRRRGALHDGRRRQRPPAGAGLRVGRRRR